MSKMHSPKHKFRAFVLIATMSVGLVTLAFLPAGGRPAYLSQLSEFKNRLLENRYSEEELSELNFLECIDKNLEKIPDGSALRIETEDGYLIQRIADISYPRLQLTETDVGYGIQVNSEPQSSQELVFSFQCSNVSFQVVKYD